MTEVSTVHHCQPAPFVFPSDVPESNYLYAETGGEETVMLVVLIKILFNIIRMSSVREQREVVLRSPAKTPAQLYWRKVLIDFLHWPPVKEVSHCG